MRIHRLSRAAREGDRGPSRFAARPFAAVRPAVSRAADRAVQRAVGFEYEMDGSTAEVLPREPKKKGFLDLFKSSEPEPEPTQLFKGKVLADHGNFDLSVDESPEGGFDLEVRIKEISDTDPQALRKLQDTAGNIQGILYNLDAKPAMADRFGGPDDVRLFGDFSGGSLQATAGLNLTALHSFLSGAQGRVYEQRLNALDARGLVGEEDPLRAQALYTRSYGQGNTDLLALATGYVAQQYSQLQEGEVREVAAVITSLATIPINAREQAPLKYAKSANSLLARTDYATILQQLPARVFQFISTKDRWRFLITSIINLYLFRNNLPPASLDDPIFPQNSIQGGVQLSLKLGEWLDSLLPSSPSPLEEAVAPKDLLSEKSYPKGSYPQDNTEQLESLGGFGAKMDEGKGGEKLPIFEFRRYLKVGIQFFPQVVEAIWNLIYRANRIKKQKK